MFAIVPIGVLGLVVLFLAAMPWQRPHPNQLFILDLVERHLRDQATTLQTPRPEAEEDRKERLAPA